MDIIIKNKSPNCQGSGCIGYYNVKGTLEEVKEKARNYWNKDFQTASKKSLEIFDNDNLEFKYEI